MRRTAIALLITGLALAGCSSTNAAPSPSSPAQRLADLDDGSHTVSQYQKALDTWGTRCTESTTTLAGYVYATVEDSGRTASTTSPSTARSPTSGIQRLLG